LLDLTTLIGSIPNNIVNLVLVYQSYKYLNLVVMILVSDGCLDGLLLGNADGKPDGRDDG
jgi:hypothetical protein